MKFIFKFLVLALLLAASKFEKNQQLALQKQTKTKAPSARFMQNTQQASLVPGKNAVSLPGKFTSRAVSQLN